MFGRVSRTWLDEELEQFRQEKIQDKLGLGPRTTSMKIQSMLGRGSGTAMSSKTQKNVLFDLGSKTISTKIQNVWIRIQDNNFDEDQKTCLDEHPEQQLRRGSSPCLD